LKVSLFGVNQQNYSGMVAAIPGFMLNRIIKNQALALCPVLRLTTHSDATAIGNN
jgi:hypothetical protein